MGQYLDMLGADAVHADAAAGHLMGLCCRQCNQVITGLQGQVHDQPAIHAHGRNLGITRCIDLNMQNPSVHQCGQKGQLPTCLLKEADTKAARSHALELLSPQLATAQAILHPSSHTLSQKLDMAEPAGEQGVQAHSQCGRQYAGGDETAAHAWQSADRPSICAVQQRQHRRCGSTSAQCHPGRAQSAAGAACAGPTPASIPALSASQPELASLHAVVYDLDDLMGMQDWQAVHELGRAHGGCTCQVAANLPGTWMSACMWAERKCCTGRILLYSPRY